jgi:hypothetical protein
VAGVVSVAGAVPGEEHPATVTTATVTTATVTAASMAETARNLTTLVAP